MNLTRRTFRIGMQKIRYNSNELKSCVRSPNCAPGPLSRFLGIVRIISKTLRHCNDRNPKVLSFVASGRLAFVVGAPCALHFPCHIHTRIPNLKSVHSAIITTAMLLAYVAPPSFAQVEGEHIGVSSAHPVAAIQDTETAAQRDARMAWWRDARFGMFIHWGLYSIPAGTWKGKQIPGIGEWIMNNASIPVEDYKALASQFNPTSFNAHDIVALAKSAGMKYIVITAKHHDGFAMFDSKADPFNIVEATPFHRDPIRELAEECRKQGMKLGFYYSQDQDWTAPGGAAYKTDHHDLPTHHWDPAQDGDFATYLHTKAIPQMKELLTNYGDFPVVIWFDTPTPDMTPALAGEIVTLLNQHPNLIWNNRLGGGYKGDTDTPEQYIPAKGYPGRDWEACMTMNDTWGYKSYDT